MPGIGYGIVNNQELRADLAAYVASSPDIDDMLIGEQVMPVFNVDAASGQFLTESISDSGTQSGAGLDTAPGSEYAEDTSVNGYRYYFTSKRTAKAVVPEEFESYLTRYNYDLQARKTALKVRGMKIRQEVRVNAAIMNEANFTSSAPVAVYTNANQVLTTGADPVADITALILANNTYGVMPDTLIISNPVYNYILKNPNFLNVYKPFGLTAPNSIADYNAVLNMFRDRGIKRVLIPMASQNTAAVGVGATPVMSPIWSNTYIWCGKTMGGSPSLGGAGRILVWSKMGGLYTIKSWWDNNTDSTQIGIKQFSNEIILGQENAQGNAAGVSTFGQLCKVAYTGS